MAKKPGKQRPSGKKKNTPASIQTPLQLPVKVPYYEDPRFLAGLISVLTCIAFFPSLKNDFMQTWDDNAYVTMNAYIRAINLHSIRLMFTKQVMGTYVPLPLLTYALDYKIYGLNPLGYHLTNLVLHLICTFFVFKLLRLLNINILFAALGALLFGIQPMRVESVAWISERKDVLYTVFYLAALITHVRFIQSGQQRAKYYRLTLLFFFLALLSKIEAVTLPLSLLLLDYFMERPLRIRLLVEKIPHFLLSLLFGIFGILILYKVGLLSVNRELAFTDRLFYGVFSLNAYIFKFFFPYVLSAIYPYPVASGHVLPLFYYLNPLLTLGLAFLIYKFARNKRAIVFGALFFFVNVVFMLQILAAGNAFLADRYTYVAYIGIIFIVVWGLEQLSLRKKPWRLPIALGVTAYIIVFMVQTYNRCEVWENGETLWTDIITKYPGQVVAAYTNRAITYSDKQEFDRAIPDFTEAIAINPRYPVSYANRGMVYGNMGQVENAIADFTKAIALDPAYKMALHNRGVAYGNLGEYGKAVSDLSRAIRIDPHYISAYNNLSIIYCQKNQIDSAISVCLAGLDVISESDVLHGNLGNCYLEKEDTEKALAQYTQCLEINNRNIDALLGMAVLCYMRNDKRGGDDYVNQSQAVDPVLNEGMSGVEKLQQSGYYISPVKKKFLSKYLP